MGITDAIACLGEQPPRDCRDTMSSLDGAAYEMKQIYQERVPYLIEEKVGGLCIIWDETFIALCRYAMSTDCMTAMSAQEREIWRYFVEFEDNHTDSATVENCAGQAVGATDRIILEENGEALELRSYPVRFEQVPYGFMFIPLEDKTFAIALTPDVPDLAEICALEFTLGPLFDVPKSYVYEDLDEVFVNIHNCVPYNDCGCSELVILENNDCHEPGTPPQDPDAIYDDLYKTGCGTEFCSATVNK